MSQYGQRRLGRGLFCSMLAAMLVPVLAVSLRAQLAGYPAPRDPDYKKAMQATVEDLMPIARLMAKKPSRRMALSPGYGIKPGESVLVVVSVRFNDKVLEALRRAMVEAGAKVDIMRTHAVEPAAYHTNAGELEFRMMGEGGAAPQSRLSGPRGTRALWEADVTAGGKGYDLVIEGTGGPNPKADYRWEYIPWDTIDKFQYSMAAFPYEIQEAIDKAMWKTITEGRKIHATDPEGTDMTWNWDPKFVGMLHENWPGYEILKQGHISPMPLFMSPEEANANGVIAGNINHAGTFPHLVLTIKNNDIVDLKGGGEYGRHWKEVLDDCKAKKIQYPGFPGIGCGWFEEAAIGTDPWRTRDLAAEIRDRFVWERGRSGVIHWGIGVSQNFEYHPAINDWYRENASKVERGGGHNHIHTYLTTMDITDANGKVTRIIDKGRLTFLDDPEIRKIAAKYGDPDDLLKEKWIPRYPGINMPGDYMKDYAQDPYSFIHPYQEKLRQEAGWTPDMGD